MSNYNVSNKNILLFVLWIALEGTSASRAFAMGGRLTVVPGQRAAEVERQLDRKQLPPGAELSVDPKQVFVLHSSAVEDLTIAPVYFQIDPAPGNKQLRQQCGVFFLQPDGTSHYLPVVGPELRGSDACAEVQAMGEMPDPGPRPRLLVLFEVTAMDGHDYSSPYVLAWDAKKNAYEVDRATSAWLVRDPASQTIAGARRVLARKP